MNIVRYQVSTSFEEIHDTYGVVNDDGTRALRIQASDYGKSMLLECNVVYRGQNLEFNDRNLSDTTDHYSPRDTQARKLTFEITPPLTNLNERQQAVAVYASSILGLESKSPIEGIDTIPGRISIHFQQD